jgi:Domain of unknown function (DUF4160)
MSLISSEEWRMRAAEARISSDEPWRGNAPDFCRRGIVSADVPVICRLGGIRIVLRSREDDRHEPHFHAIAAERSASVKIGDERVYASTLTSAELAVVVEWAVRRRAELRQAWDAVQEGRVPGQIAP